jgi:hypothetical protein
VADQLSENTQHTLLQNAVIGMNALREVQINCDLQKATHGTVMTFSQYHTLLINSATGYDKFNSETLFEDHASLYDDFIYEDEPSTQESGIGSRAPSIRDA